MTFYDRTKEPNSRPWAEYQDLAGQAADDERVNSGDNTQDYTSTYGQVDGMGGLQVSPSSFSGTTGGTQTFTASKLVNVSGAVTWKSSNTSIVTVNATTGAATLGSGKGQAYVIAEARQVPNKGGGAAATGKALIVNS